ncbi:hypothetical protein RHMOL_Rhmol02G0157500 [Rhododendron molle]|uniref:Uncharacterized protein n=1 Tax=Rhododendron molle TaxID=49168 RepID=A0ACC0PQ93_RHOML|nr:hypothetical protein RHMOL_Rhmol02G0157500 [Rhododendron molle]
MKQLKEETTKLERDREELVSQKQMEEEIAKPRRFLNPDFGLHRLGADHAEVRFRRLAKKLSRVLPKDQPTKPMHQMPLDR